MSSHSEARQADIRTSEVGRDLWMVRNLAVRNQEDDLAFTLDSLLHLREQGRSAEARAALSGLLQSAPAGQGGGDGR